MSDTDVRKIIVHHGKAPGDVAVLTAAIRDLHRRYPGKVQTDVRTVSKDVWENNKNITPLEYGSNVETHNAKYSDLIQQSNKCGLHFLNGFIYDINKRLNLDVKLTEFRPDIYISEFEQTHPLVEGDYWVFASGGKNHLTAKLWDPKKWQEVVDALRGKVDFVQVGRSCDYHPEITGSNVLDLRGKTNKLRDLIRLIYHSKGVACIVTCLMHFAAAFYKPCVVVAGGREPYNWEAYTRDNVINNMRLTGSDDFLESALEGFVEHRYLHMISKLECCLGGGCWKDKVKKQENPESYCVNTVVTPGGITLPKCMDMLSVDDVVNAILSYNKKVVEAGEADTPIILPTDPELMLGAKRGGDQLSTNKLKIEEGRALPKVSKSQTKIRKAYKSLNPPIAICVCCYGNGIIKPRVRSSKALTARKTDIATFHELHRRCLTSILRYTPVSMNGERTIRLYVGMNEADSDTLSLINNHIAGTVGKDNIKIIKHDDNIKKYPLMREMFASLRDEKWIVWFDDDSHVQSHDWLTRLCLDVEEKAGSGYAQFGDVRKIELNPNQVQWITKAPWYTGKEIEQQNGRYIIHFVTGGYWALSTEAIRKLDWPDERIVHNGGDVMLSVALKQHGYSFYQSNHGVCINDAPRRGYREHPAGWDR